MKPANVLPDPKNRIAFSILENLVIGQMKEQPLVIGITGAGGAGKTTFARNIVRFYGLSNCLTIDLDDYLISRSDRGKLGLTGYNPLSNNLELARENIEMLKQRKFIKKPVYNHNTGEVIKSEKVYPKELIVIEGVTTLYEELRDLNDVSFFLDALETTQIQSRIRRDVDERGYTLEQALTLFDALRPDYKKFIEPNKEYANIIFSVGIDYIMHPLRYQQE